MSDLSVRVREWLPDTDIQDCTFARLGITVTQDNGSRHIFTKARDTLENTTLDEVNLSAGELALWVAINWWRLRWEPPRTGYDWECCHHVQAIGGGYHWPNLVLWNDGGTIRFVSTGDPDPVPATIQYLQSHNVEVAPETFECGVDAFFSQVEKRLVGMKVPQSDFLAVLEELREERNDPMVARHCKWQALAGYDPSTAPDGWLEQAEALASDFGHQALEEGLAALEGPEMPLDALSEAVKAMKASKDEARLDWVPSLKGPDMTQEAPWRAASRYAKWLREQESLPHGPIPDEWFGDRLGLSVEIEGDAPGPLFGGYRKGDGRVFGVSSYTKRIDNQRFFFARLIAAAAVSPGENLLPVAKGKTALQKFSRAFGQEFLCPKRELMEFLGGHPLEDQNIERAAAHFRVSEMIVQHAYENAHVQESVFP